MIPHKNWKPAEEQGSVLGDEGNEESHQGWEPYYHQGGAQCKGHHIHKWPWEGQENPQYVGQGPDLTSWRGHERTKLRAPGRYLLNGACHWYDKYCAWMQDLVPGRYLICGAYYWYDRYCAWTQDLLYGSQAQVNSNDVVVSKRAIPGTNENREGLVTSSVPRAVVTKDTREMPSGSKFVFPEWNSTVADHISINEMYLIICEKVQIIGSTRNPYDLRGRYAYGWSDAIFEIL